MKPLPKVWGYVGTFMVFCTAFVGIVNPALDKATQTGSYDGVLQAILTALIAGLGAVVNQLTHSATGAGPTISNKEGA